MSKKLLFFIFWILIDSTLFASPSKRSRSCSSSFLTSPLKDYIKSSHALPDLFNVLSLRDYHRTQGLPRFSKLADRFKQSYRQLYGSKQDNPLGSVISKELGRGWMGRVVQLEDGRVIKLVVQEVNKTSNIGIYFETEAWVTYHLRKQRRYKIKVAPIVSVGQDGMYLEKRLIPSELLGDKILKKQKKLTKKQLSSLQNLHSEALRLVRDTGIPLDLKADNMYWSEGGWVLLDPIGSIYLSLIHI